MQFDQRSQMQTLTNTSITLLLLISIIQKTASSICCECTTPFNTCTDILCIDIICAPPPNGNPACCKSTSKSSWNDICAQKAQELCPTTSTTKEPTLQTHIQTTTTTQEPNLCCACANSDQVSTTGCIKDKQCQDIICTTDNYCCQFEWDIGCTKKANNICIGNFTTTTTASPIDTTPSPVVITTPKPTDTGTCCTVNKECKDLICTTIDDYCCNFGWDNLCDSIAENVCKQNTTTTTTLTHPTTIPTATITTTHSHVHPIGTCCIVNKPCKDLICETIDDYCCNFGWDNICDTLAQDVCDSSSLSETNNPTIESTIVISTPTDFPTPEPSGKPTDFPTVSPTNSNRPTRSIKPISTTITSYIPTTNNPFNSPSHEPTFNPTNIPTPEPSPEPTPEPTPKPTPNPTSSVTPEPTHEPTPEPTPKPTRIPTSEPTPIPTDFPTEFPLNNPTPSLTTTPQPTPNPTPNPTRIPTSEPTPIPTDFPTEFPTPSLTTTPEPTPNPTSNPTFNPTFITTTTIPEPTPNPTPNPTAKPTHLPTNVPSVITTNKPTLEPISEPTTLPTTGAILTDIPTETPIDNVCCDCMQSSRYRRCYDSICEEIICEMDAFCCEEKWDYSCVVKSQAICYGTEIPKCCNCTTNDEESTGCEDDKECEIEICNNDSYCCHSNWDRRCANKAYKICKSSM